MTGLVIVILICSAFMHAGWNLLARGRAIRPAHGPERSRRAGDATYFMLQMYVLIAAAGLIPALGLDLHLGMLPGRVWLCAAVSGLFSAVYSLALAKGYGSADFTVVYPVARALPVLMVAAGDVALGRFPTPVGWAGMALVTLGCFLAPLRSLRGFHPNVYFHRSSLWMLLAALGTAGYTLVDKTASGWVTPGPLSAFRYGYIYFALTGVFYAGLWAAFARGDSTGDGRSWRRGALGAVMIFGAYWLILWAYQLVERASYVLAFRQLSIIIGVILAFAIYKEKGKAVRLTAALLIALGLIVIGVWGRAFPVSR